MTIEERLEALTMNMELLALESAKHDKQIAENSLHINQLAKIVQQTHESIQGLVRTAEAHERRISHLEGDRLT